MRRKNDLFKSHFFLSNSLRVLLTSLLLITAFPSFGAGLSIQYEVIARSGSTPVPEGSGTVTSLGHYPAIDNNGNVVFTASGAVDAFGETQNGIYTLMNGQYQMVANKQTLVPGGGGATFNYFPSSGRSDIDGGRVAFTGNLSGTTVGLYSNVGQTAPSDIVEIIVNDGVEWESFKQPWVDGNLVAVPGQRLFPSSHTTILRWNGANFSTNFADPGTGYNMSYATEASISGDATIFRRAKTGASELAISNGSNHETLVVLNSTPVPGHAGATFSGVAYFSSVDQGGQDAVFQGNASSSSLAGVYKRVNGGALEQVADNAMVIPGAGNSIFYSFLNEKISLANGQVLFAATGPDFLDGIYTDIGGELSVIIDDQNNNTIELNGQMEQITRFDLSRKSFAYTPQGYMLVFHATLQSGGTALIRATINTGGTTTEPNISVSGNGSYGNVGIDSSSTHTFSVSNSGDANLVIGNLYGLAAPFSIVTDNCSGSTVATSSSCTLYVRFTPTTTGSRSDTLVIPSNDPDQATINIAVSGTGTEVPVPNIAVSGSGAFGDVEVDTTSTRSFSVNNSGNASLTINSIGGLVAPFSIVSNNCGSSLAASASCSFAVRFAPTTASSNTGTVVISSNDPDQSSVNIGVSGTGTDSSVNELRNIATRAEVREGNEILNGGFVIIGETQKCVIVQGLGQSVDVPEGVTRLADPMLELKSGLTSIAKNDNWQDQTNPSDVQLIENSGRAPEDILEAAIYKCLDPGAYTVLVTGYNSTTGIGMVAIYDADDGSSYLKNISTRSWVGTDHAISIAGFVVTGDARTQGRVLGLAPSLESKVPPDAPLLRDPQLRLYQGANLIETNDDWGDATNAAAIGALPAPLQPTHNKEPAILMTLEPGLYTAHLLGVDGTTGIANVAVYDLTGR